MSTWKQVERRIAQMLGGERVPVTGRQRGSAPDIDHEWLSLEVKHRKSLPQWVDDALDQAVASADSAARFKRADGEMCDRPFRKLPVAIFHESGRNHKDNYVVIKMGDFIDWFIE